MNEEVNMFYGNADSLKFCTADSPEKAGDKPQFRTRRVKASTSRFCVGTELRWI